tara:strand:+ start:984 stop:1814 length:831 start_codon:yes stop_codon:yes gene_type:complete
MKILVTGYQGFIGSNVASYLKAKGHDVEGFPWEINKFPDAQQYDRIIHLGAISSTTERDVEKIMQHNYEYTMKLIEICDMMGTSLQYASSASVYGEQTHFREDLELDPRSPYAWTKYLVDRFVTQHLKEFRVNIQGFRYFNVYGHGEDHKGDMMSPISKFTKQAKETGVIKVFEGSGKFKRDFICVEDVALMHEKMLDVDQSGIWNIGSGVATSFLQVAQVVANKYGAKIEEIPMPENIKAQYQKFTCADNDKLKKTIEHKCFSVGEWVNGQPNQL